MKTMLMAALALFAGICAAGADDTEKRRAGALTPGMCVNETDRIVPCSAIVPTDMAPGIDSTPRLIGTRWRIKRINGAPALVGLNKPSLTFKDGSIHVSTGCRGFSARTLDPSKPTRFQIMQDVVIAIACAEPLEEQEIALGKLIEATSRIHLDDTNHLILLSSDGGTLVAVLW